MAWFNWFFAGWFFLIYIVYLFTVCTYTFKKGHIVLGILGIIFPFLWLIGAVLPAKRGSLYDIEEGRRAQAQMQEMRS
jgi:hypothetical protein